MKKINMEKVKGVAKEVLTGASKIILYGLAIGATYATMDKANNYVGYGNIFEFNCDYGNSGSKCNEGYGDAVKAIMNSSMGSYYKDAAVSALRKNGTKEFYKAVEEVANSNAGSYYKAEAIKNMSR